jgi:glycosyltransferase involved in cell wall biosynthesis
MPPLDKPEIRVLHVLAALGIGGAETWLISLLKYFRQVKNVLPVRVQFDFCLTSGAKAEFDEEAASLGARLFYPRYCRNNLLTFIREFRTILSNERYDVIHDHQDYTAGLHFMFGIGHLPPVRIAHIHTTFIHIDNYSSSRIRKLTAATGKLLLARLATHVIGTSRQVISEYGFDEDRFGKVKRGAVHCGFDVARFRGGYERAHNEICREFGWEKTAKILLFVGRLNPINNPKNSKFALEVAKVCIKKDSRIRFLMAGGGEDVKMKLEDKVRGWGLQKSILLIGARSDIPRLMSGSDLLLFPSVAEGLGMVAVEAQAAGLRVLASDAIPRECEAVPGMVEFKPLDAGPSAWAEEALKLVRQTRPDQPACNMAVMDSPFSIENSATRLIWLYTGIEELDHNKNVP